MICRRCGADVAPTKFCAKCGALLNGKRCNTCGAIMGVNESYCAECGTPVSGHAPTQNNNYGQTNYGGQQGSYGGQQGSYAQPSYPAQQPTSLKKKPKHQTVQTGNKHVLLRGLIGSLGALGALAVMVSFYLFGDLISLNVMGESFAVSPILFSTDTFTFSVTPIIVESWLPLANIEWLGEYFKNFANIGNVFSDAVLREAFLKSLPVLVYQFAYFLSAILLALAVIIAVFKFIVGMLSKKEFDLMMPLGLGLTAFLSMFVSLVMLGGFDGISYTSGLMIGIYAGVGAIVLQIALNVALAGKRFAKGGAIAKWVTNLGLLAGAVIMLMFIPFNIVKDGAEISIMATLTKEIETMISVGLDNIDMTMFVYLALLAVSVIGFIFALSSAAVKAGKRASRTFKFDGYADKGYLKSGIGALISVIVFAVIAVLFGGEISTGLVMFVIGGVLLFLFSIVNRAVLNKDQLV